MAIVPRDPDADDEVISYWIKKQELTSEEIAALVCGVNPFAWKEQWREFSVEVPLVAASKQQDIKDVLTLLEHRLPAPHGVKTLLQWKSALSRLGVPLPEWLILYQDPRFERALERIRSPDYKEEFEKRAKALLELKGCLFF